jgi:hypothetical protein
LTKEELVKLLVLIESVYSNCIFKDTTIQQWFQFCSEMNHDKVQAKLKNHIRKSPFPPIIADIAVFDFDKNDFQGTLQEWMKNGRGRMGHESTKLPDWLTEYSTRKSF